MLGGDPQIVSLASPLWVAAGSAAIAGGIVSALAFRRRRKGFAGAAVGVALILLGAALGGSLTWAIFGNAQRSALQARAEVLSAQAMAPGSALGCLNAVIGDTIQSDCERAVFASPANVATAVSYVEAQFALLSDLTTFTRRGGPSVASILLPLRRTLEADPFGLLAQILVMQGCTSEKCPAFAFLHDPSHVRTNIIAQTLRHYLDHYREVWAKSSEASMAALSESAPMTTEAIAPGKHKVDIDFPTAASIPPISIMNPEPKGPANANAARKEKSSASDVDPVWTPAPAQAAK
jgi:hypothetical protein